MPELTPSEREVFDEIAEMAPLTAHEIASNLGKPTSTVRGVLARLKRQDLVVFDDYQQPITIWVLSDKGEQLYAQSRDR